MTQDRARQAKDKTRLDGIGRGRIRQDVNKTEQNATEDG